MSCQPDGLKRSGWLRTGVLCSRSRAMRRRAGTEQAHLESMRTPVRPIERIARVEYPLAANQRSDEVDVELLKRAVVHQQNYGFDVPQSLLEREQRRGQTWRAGLDVRVTQANGKAALDRQFGDA